VSRTTLFALVYLVFSGPALGQTAPNDSQTLQSLLTEVRQLRQDVQTAALAARRGQILIYRLHAQQAVVDRLSERLEGTKTELTQLDRQRESWAAQVKRMEERKSRVENPEERKELEDIIASEKQQAENRAAEEQELQSRKSGLEEELRTEQAKLGRLQDELDRLDRVLEDSSRQGGKPQ